MEGVTPLVHCAIHNENSPSHYCFTEQRPICEECLSSSCNKHNTKDFDDAFDTYEEELLTLCDDIEDKLGESPEVETINLGNLDFQTALNDRKTQCIGEINSKYDELIARIQIERDQALQSGEMAFTSTEKKLKDLITKYQDIQNFQNIREDMLEAMKNDLMTGLTSQKVKYLKKILKTLKQNDSNIPLIKGENYEESMKLDIQTKSSGNILATTFSTPLEVSDEYTCLYQLAMNGKQMVCHHFDGSVEDKILSILPEEAHLFGSAINRNGDIYVIGYVATACYTFKYRPSTGAIDKLAALPRGWQRGKASVCCVDTETLLLAGGFNEYNYWDPRCGFLNPVSGELEEIQHLPFSHPSLIMMNYTPIGTGGVIYAVCFTQRQNEIIYKVGVYNHGATSVPFENKKWTQMTITVASTARLAQKLAIIPLEDSRISIIHPNLATADLLDLKNQSGTKVEIKESILWSRHLLVVHHGDAAYLTSDTKEKVFVYDKESHVVTTEDLLTVKAVKELPKR